MIEAVKNTEQARSEYRFISAFEMDALYYGRQKGREEGRQEGLQEGRQEGLRAGLAKGRSEGISKGIAQGAYQNKLETAKILKQLGDSVQKIIQATGLSLEEIEKL